MSSDTSAIGDGPALGQHATAQASGFAALAPDPAPDRVTHGPVPHSPAPHSPVAEVPASGSPASGAPARHARGLTVVAAAGIGIAILIMIAASLVRGGWMLPPVAMPAAGPPWELPIRHVSADLVTYGLWLAALLGTGGVAAGLLAIHRGARMSARVLLVAGLITVAVLTVLPPAGSTDALDYATYGRLLALGHSPYVTTPAQLRHVHDAFARSIPQVWEHVRQRLRPTGHDGAVRGGQAWRRLRGPDHVLAQAVGLGRVRARRPGPGPAAAAQAGAAAARPPALDGQPAAALGPGRGRAPGRAGGHGGPARAADARRRSTMRPGPAWGVSRPQVPSSASPPTSRSTMCCSGWVRRGPCAGPWPAVALAGGAALAVLVPSYACFGTPAVRALLSRRNQSSADNFYRALLPHSWHQDFGMIATVLVIAVAVLTLRRLPPGAATRPAIRPTVALCAAWLFLWPYQLPWYDAMIICVLVLYPASRLDWLVLARLAAGTIANMPGNPYLHHSHLLLVTDHFAVRILAPAVMLAAAIALVALCVTGRWKLRDAPGPERARIAGGPSDPGLLAAD